MIRHCNGHDVNLWWFVDPSGRPVLLPDLPPGELHVWMTERGIQDGPCRCGKVFDDVTRRVIYPHEDV